MKSCDGCGATATTECPYCKADSCDECVPICEHDVRKPKEPTSLNPLPVGGK